MSDDQLPAFKDWLAAAATRAGYDVSPGGGGRSALARAADVSPAQIGRALAGQSVPNPETLRSIAAALRVSALEMFIRAGVIQAADMPDVASPVSAAGHGQYAAPDAMDLLASQLGVPAKSRGLFAEFLGPVARQFAETLRREAS